MQAELQLLLLLKKLHGHPLRCPCPMAEEQVDVDGLRVFVLPPAGPEDGPSVTWVRADLMTPSPRSGRLP